MAKFLFNPFARGQAILAGKGLNNYVRKQVSLLAPGSTVLSIGAGGPVGGMLEAIAKERNVKVTTFDIDADKGPDIVGDIATYDFSDHSYDFIFMIEVLEHVKECHKVPAQLYDALKEGGTLFLTTPFIFPLHERPYDYFRFTRYGLEYLFSDFKDVDVQERNNWAESINVLLARTYKEKRIEFRLLGALMVLYALLLQPLHWVLGHLFKSDFLTTGYVMEAKK